MPQFSGLLRAPDGRIALIVSRYHERVTTRLLEGAQACCRDAGVADEDVDVCWVAGAFELGIVAAELAGDEQYAAVVALGAVVRGETPHFDFVAGETARILADVARETGVPVGFGLLTTDTMAQAEARAGGDAGNKGYEATEAALSTAALLTALRERLPDAEG